MTYAKKIKIRLPPEVGGKTYEIYDPKFPPRRIQDKFISLMNVRIPMTGEIKEEDLSVDMSVSTEIKELLLTEMVVDPKITREFLQSDDANPLEMELLATYLMDNFKLINQEDIEELKKKVTIV